MLVIRVSAFILSIIGNVYYIQRTNSKKCLSIHTKIITIMSKKLKEVTKNNPCPHCGKTDWCYSLGELTVCNRDCSPTLGWYQTNKTDKDGHYFYALIENRERFKEENFRDFKSKKLRPPQTRTWEYHDRNNNPLVRVIRIDDGNGGKPKRWQEKWDGEKWVKGLRGVKRENITIYRYQELKKAIEDGTTTIYIVEGETCADALWNLGIPATTNIGGSGKWNKSDTQYLIELLLNSELIIKGQGRRSKKQRLNSITELSTIYKSTKLIANENSELCQAENLSGQNSESVNGINSKNNENGLISSTHKKIYIEEDNQNVENYQQDSELKNLENNNHLPSHQSRLLNIVLCPDRDIPGVKHMDIIEEELITNSELRTQNSELKNLEDNQNVENYPQDSELKNLENNNLCQFAECLLSSIVNIQWLYAFPESTIWNSIPNSSGLDVIDWIEDYRLSAEDIINSVESSKRVFSNSELTNRKSKQNKKIPQNKTANLEGQFLPANTNKKNPSNSKISEYLDKSESEENQMNSELNNLLPSDNNFIEIGIHYTQMCVNDLYSDKPWIAIEGQLYEWNGKFYQKASNGGERKRIADWCNTTAVKVGKGWKYAYATPTHIDNIWRWLLSYFSVKTEEVNPPGINCLNGVVKINWFGNKVSWELVPHNPNIIYTYISEVNYDPSADSSEADRMLSCLEPIQQELFLKTIACALDLKTVRKYRGREVRALLCQGHGNNGKDTLREATRMLFGYTLTNATVSDFAGYDNGRKFSLAKLEGASINWSSENSSFNNLDELQSLKVAITGEPLDIERKGIDEHEVMLNTVFLFNVNEVPNLSAAMEAIQSRWAVLSFNKTYKKKANPSKGEIEADSRFRYDPNFLQEKVCSALLNKLLNALTDVMAEGIDYSCTEEAIKNIQEETNHLWGFAREVGIDYQSDGRVYINDLWELLYKWYINNGTLEIVNENGKERKIWHEQVKRSDKNVKAPNQVYQRFSELFPKIKKERDNNYYSSHRGQFYLSGIEIKLSEIIEELISAPVNNFSAPVSAPISAPESLAKTNIEAIEAIYAQVSSKNNKSEKAIEKITNASVSTAINESISKPENLIQTNIEAIYEETNSENYQSKKAINQITSAPVDNFSAAINKEIIKAETFTQNNIEAILSSSDEDINNLNEMKTIIEIISALSPNDKALIRQTLNNE